MGVNMKSLDDMKNVEDKRTAEDLFQGGKNYYYGTNGLGQDRAEATCLFEQASEKGHEEASYYLGQCFENGHGVDIALERAAELYEKASKKPVPLGRYWNRPAWLANMPVSLDRVFRKLGDQYKYGQNGKSKNLIQAAQYYCSAPLAANYQLYEIGLIFENEGNLKFASECYYLARDTGRVVETRTTEKLDNPEIQYNLGTVFMNGGQLVKKDDDLAFSWIKRAVLQSHSRAEFQLGVMFEEGRGTPKNKDKAIICFARSWHRKDLSVISYMADIFKYDPSPRPNLPRLPINVKEAIEYFRQRVLGHPSAHLIEVFDIPSDSRKLENSSLADPPLLVFSGGSERLAMARTQQRPPQLPSMLPVPSESPRRSGMLPPLSESQRRHFRNLGI